MATYLVTGASRGLGLAIAAQLAASPDSEVSLIFATSRKASAPELTELAENSSGRVVPVQLDAKDPDSLRAAIEMVRHHLQQEGKGLDVLINNAGYMPVTDGKIEKADDLTDVFHTNVTQTHLVTREFLPLLREGERKTIANITSSVGSISQSARTMMPTHAYKISKAALNMMTVQYALQYEEEGFCVLAISPGWLRTDMGGEFADLSAETGARAVLEYVKNASKELNGRFLNIHVPDWEHESRPDQYDGKDIPW
ncbi:hypothetical protein BDV18DRAFT_162554 [Aspergillus unguis]